MMMLVITQLLRRHEAERQTHTHAHRVEEDTRIENREHHRAQHGVTAGAMTGFDGPVGLLPPPLTERFSVCGSFILVMC